MRRDTMYAILLGILISIVILYLMMMPQLGPDPRTWNAQIEQQMHEAELAQISECRTLLQKRGK